MILAPIWAIEFLSGAKVVAVEPQPTLFEFLVKNYGKDENVVLLQGVVSSEVGTVTFYHNTRNPSLSTIDHSWIEEKKSDPTWGKYRWDREIEMSALTLDSLIGRYGVPDFCKIDVEGAELIVLSGLSVPINCLSFEYLTINKERSVRSIERIEELGRYEYNWTFSEFSALKSPSWLSAEQMISAINKMNGKSYSGDVYARLIERKR